ncbi:MAG TPA: hypothetical protein VMT45_05520 [Thermoanaerobaculaceae bacterium]|nr:hypothetical protein [Thermoanaerobaculaceae bacterium]
MVQQLDPEVAALLELLESGGEPREGELTRLLRRPGCPGVVVERLSKCPWVLTSHRVLQLVVRHPRCPRHFAWDALPRLGWHDLLEVGRDPRTQPAIRKQSERKLIERIVNLTLGERTALARQAPRALIAILLTDEQPVCVEALLSNPQFTEMEALRLLNSNRNPKCVLVLLRHPVWGRRPEVLRSAVRSRIVPLGVALGLLALLPETELVGLATSAEVDGRLRDAANRLLSQRHAETSGEAAAPS